MIKTGGKRTCNQIGNVFNFGANPFVVNFEWSGMVFLSIHEQLSYRFFTCSITVCF